MWGCWELSALHPAQEAGSPPFSEDTPQVTEATEQGRVGILTGQPDSEPASLCWALWAAGSALLGGPWSRRTEGFRGSMSAVSGQPAELSLVYSKNSPAGPTGFFHPWQPDPCLLSPCLQQNQVVVWAGVGKVSVL